MWKNPIRFATFLAPNMLPVYRFISAYTGKKLGLHTELFVGTSFNQFAAGQADVGFICGLPYIQLTGQKPAPISLVAAPVLQGNRYHGLPIYYSDVIVRRDSPFQSFWDLRGCRWSYNDRDSHSGYNLTRYHLVRAGETKGYFGEVFEAGFHQRSIDLVLSGLVDASAIDSQVLGIEMRTQPELASQIRVIESLGPSSIQPVVASNRLPKAIIKELGEVIIDMGSDPSARSFLDYGLIEGFTAVVDGDYDDIRNMLAAAEQAAFLSLK